MPKIKPAKLVRSREPSVRCKNQNEHTAVEGTRKLSGGRKKENSAQPCPKSPDAKLQQLVAVKHCAVVPSVL
jgi:hypothetical protein